VLDIAYCNNKIAPSAGATQWAFLLPEGSLQDVVDAMPRHPNLHLWEVLHEMADVDPKVTYYGGPPRYLLRFKLRSPTVTTLIIGVCHGNWYKIRDKSAIPKNGIDLNMSNLQILCYRGHWFRLMMKQPMPRLARHELDNHSHGRAQATTNMTMEPPRNWCPLLRNQVVST
jgi:hypothetical protein